MCEREERERGRESDGICSLQKQRLGKRFFIMHEMPKEFVAAYQGGPIKARKSSKATHCDE